MINRKVRAQGMVEFALVLPLLLVLVYGVIEAGRLLFIYSATQTASREAARYGSAAGDIGGNIAHYEDCAGIRAAARRLGSLAGIQDANIGISYDHGPGTGAPFATCPPGAGTEVNLGDRIIVQVMATFRPLVPLVRFTTFNISTTARRTIIKDVAIEGTPPSPITPTVSFVLADQSQLEDAGDMVVTVQLTAATSKTVTVPFVVDGSATNGVDYTITSSPVVIPPGDTTVDIVIHVTADQVDEDDELVVITMGNPTNAIKGSPSVHRATILDDDDAPEVYFATTDQIHSEEVDTIAVLHLSSASSRDVTVHYSVSGSALGAGTDYSMTASPIVIPSGDTTYSIVVDVIDDTLDEDDETITIALDMAVNASVGMPDTHTITIIDNDDPPLVSFTWASQIGTETTGTMAVEVQLSALSSKEITVPFSIGGTATQGVDYTITASPIVIPAGQLTAATTIHVVQDSDNNEPDETIILTMLTPTNATKGTPSVHTATIANALNFPTVYFTAASQSGNENVGTLQITARLSAAYPLDVSIPFTVGGTATSGSDFTITSSPVVIPAGGNSVDIVITVINDSIDEDDETVVVTMGSPTNAVKGTPSTHTATIVNNDLPPVVNFTTASQIADEDTGTVSATVQLSVISGKDVTVPFTLGGTAQGGAGNDYTITSSPIVILAGQQTADISLTINDDTVTEPDETVIITLGTPTNATLGTPAAHTVTIRDNEPICPSPDSLPFFGSGADKNKLTWTLQSPNPLTVVNLLAVTIRWPSSSAANVTAITFGDPLYSGNALPPYLAVNTPSPLWSGAFATRQMIFKFDKNPKSVSGDFYQVTATFEGCPPISGIIPSD